MKNITLPGAIVMGSIIIGVAFISIQLLKQSSIERQQDKALTEKRAAEYWSTQEAKREQEQMSSLRVSCLNKAHADLSADAEAFKLYRDTRCVNYEMDSPEQWGCLGAVGESFSESKSVFEQAEKDCYDRFPVN